MEHLIKQIYDYLTILSIILFTRCNFIICYRFLYDYIKFFHRKNSFLNNYCMIGKINKNIFRIWGLSALWLIVKYWDYLKILRELIYKLIKG